MPEERFASLEALKSALGKNPDNHIVTSAILEYDSGVREVMSGVRRIAELEGSVAKMERKSKGKLSNVVVTRAKNWE